MVFSVLKISYFSYTKKSSSYNIHIQKEKLQFGIFIAVYRLQVVVTLKGLLPHFCKDKLFLCVIYSFLHVYSSKTVRNGVKVLQQLLNSFNLFLQPANYFIILGGVAVEQVTCIDATKVSTRYEYLMNN